MNIYKQSNYRELIKYFLDNLKSSNAKYTYSKFAEAVGLLKFVLHQFSLERGA